MWQRSRWTPLLLVALLLIIALAPARAPGPPHGAVLLHAAPVLVGRPHGALLASRSIDRPAAPSRGPSTAGPYVLQEGLEYVAEDGETGIPPAEILAGVLLPSTGLPTQWILSGLSSTGDRYQLWGAYNLSYTEAGCPTSGYTLGYEVDASTGSTSGSHCVAAITPASGNYILLDLNLACGGSVGVLCLNLSDSTQDVSASPLVAQPTPTATYFQNELPSRPNAHGYFTGVETQVVDDVAASGCFNLSGVPTASYDLAGYLPTDPGAGGFLGENLSEYQVFANETEPDGSVCASYLSPLEAVPATIQMQYFQGGNTSDGSHWMSVQNSTKVDQGPSMGRFLTDVVPVTAFLQFSASNADDGQTLQGNLVPGGGVGPYVCAWYLDGAPIVGSPFQGCQVSLTVEGSGPENLSVYAIDSDQNNRLAWGGFTAYPDPTALTPIATPAGIDVGQSIRFTDAVSGGFGGFTYRWDTNTIPLSNCSSPVAALFACLPPGPGMASVWVQVADADNYSVTSPVLTFTTSPDPTVAIALTVGSPPLLDVGQGTTVEAYASGGSGGDQYSWTLPPGAFVLVGSTVTFHPAMAGDFSLNVTVTDSNGYSVASAPISITVESLPTVDLTSPAPDLTVGQNLTIHASIGGEAGGLTYVWSGVPTGCSPPSGLELSCTPTTIGTFNVTVTVTDRNGGSASGSVMIAVRPSTNGPSQSGIPLTDLDVYLVVVLAAIAVAVLVQNRRRRPRPPPAGYVIVSGPRVVPPRDR